MKEKKDFIGTWEEYKQQMKEKTDFILIKEKTNFIATLEEYKQLFTHFFCDPKPRSDKVTRNFDIVEELVLLNSRDLGSFTLEKNKFQIDASVNFSINAVNLWYITDMEKDGRKIKIYREDFLIGIFYLPKQIQLEFVITWTNQPYSRVVSIYGIWIKSMVGEEKKTKEKKDYELKWLSEEKGIGRRQIRIQTKDYREHMERIVSYAKESECLEIIFDREKIASPVLCLNGLYLFGVSRIKLDKERARIEIFLSQKKGQSQKEYSLWIYLGEEGMEIYKKHDIIYLVCPLGDDKDMENDTDMEFLSTKENLRLGHSIYR